MFKFLENIYFGFKDEKINDNFNRWQYDNSEKQIKYILILTAFLYLLMGTINLFICPLHIYNYIIYLHLFIIPTYLFLLSFLVYKKINIQLIETLLFLAPIMAAIFHTIIFINLDEYSSYQTELYLMIFWTLTISGLRLHKAIIVALIIFLIGEIYPYVSYETQDTTFILHTMWMIISLLFGVVGGLLLHQSKKETFKKELEFQSLATTDKLTGLYNRVKLDSILIQELRRAKRYNCNIGILLLDIDYFKDVNDTHGHIVGDELLISISKNIQKNIRTTDYLFRWGGEEFLVICLEVTKDDILALGEKIRANIAKEEFKDIGFKTISIGATLNNETDCIDSIVKRADEALYEAKKNGRNKVCYK